MNCTTPVVAALAAFSLASALAAQSTLHLQGTLRLLPNGYRLDEMSTPVVAADLDLQPFAGRIVELAGSMHDLGRPVFAVDSVALATATLQAADEARLGRTLQVRVDAPGTGLRCLYAALGGGMLSLEPYQPHASGMLWLDVPSLITIDVGPIAESRTDLLAVPNVPELAGVQVVLQASVLPDSGGPLRFLNAERATLQN